MEQCQAQMGAGKWRAYLLCGMEEVGGVHKGGCLILDRFDPPFVAVAQCIDSYASSKVQVLFA